MKRKVLVFLMMLALGLPLVGCGAGPRLDLTEMNTNLYLPDDLGIWLGQGEETYGAAIEIKTGNQDVDALQVGLSMDSNLFVITSRNMMDEDLSLTYASAPTLRIYADSDTDSYIEFYHDGTDAHINTDGSDIVFDQSVTASMSSESPFEIEEDDEGATGAILEFEHDSASPAAIDSIGVLKFFGNDDGGNEVTYAEVGTTIIDPTDGSETSAFSINLMDGSGSLPLLPMFRFNGDASSFTISRVDDGAEGASIQLVQESVSPAADDLIGMYKFVGNDDGGNETEYAQIHGVIVDPTDGSEAGGVAVTVQDGTGSQTLAGRFFHNGSNGIVGAGDSTSEGMFSSVESQDVVLMTGDEDTGTIRIAHGVDGHITLTPDGSGSVVLNGESTFNGFSNEDNDIANVGDINVDSVSADGTSVDYEDVNILELTQEDVGATCTLGQVRLDTGGATVELCYCQATDTWLCADMTSGPTD